MRERRSLELSGTSMLPRTQRKSGSCFARSAKPADLFQAGLSLAVAVTFCNHKL